MIGIDQKIDLWIKERQEALIGHAMDLIRIRSICNVDPAGRYPFGSGCARVLDQALNLCAGMGLRTRNLDYYCGTATLPGQGRGRIGVFIHLDTAPETDAWTFGAFSPYVKDGYLFGRGSSDNKGAAVAAIYVLRCLQELGLPLQNSVELFFGCSKKSYMEDLDHYLSRVGAPDLSLVADASFPVCLGEKGSLNSVLSCDVSDGNLVDFRGGRAENMVPDQVFALLEGLEYEQVSGLLRSNENFSVIPVGGLVKISTTGVGGHAAFPEQTVNPVPRLARLLLQHDLVRGRARGALAYLTEAFSDCAGKGLDVAVEDPVFGKTTHIGGRVRVEEGVLLQSINVRYVPGIDASMINEKISHHAGRHGFRYRFLSDSPPHSVPRENRPVMELLQSISNGVLGTDLPNYTMGGVTYAKVLPNAYAYGPNRDDLPQDTEGRGGGHQADESVRIQTLLDFVKIYVLSLLELDQLNR